jgi:ATP-dependent Lon protease
VVAKVVQLLKLPDSTIKLLVEGIKKVKIHDLIDEPETNMLLASFSTQEDVLPEDDHKTEALSRTVKEVFGRYAKISKNIAPEIVESIARIEDPRRLVSTIVTQMSVKMQDKQNILEELNIEKSVEAVYSLIQNEINLLHTEKKIRGRVKNQMEKIQKDYYLNEQLKAIHKEMDSSSDGADEITALENQIKKLKLNKELSTKILGEIKKLRMMNPMSAEAGVVRNYVDWIISVPWQKNSRLQHDIKKAEEILNNDHYGLDKVKDRILEYLAVQQRVKKPKGSILCLVGAPGVGKTSLARSLADASGRKYVRVALGGVHDESEIRGHRRTYIGSMPGRIIQSMKRAKTSNPLLLLDEIDKMTRSSHGDPSSALLEVLDPEQNSSFHDHFLDVDYDLSNVMFIATANNSAEIPGPLRDRMEIIHISGYTEDEKYQIASNYLIPKQMKEHGLKSGELSIGDDALYDLIRYYTREAGVRNLQREISAIARKSLREIIANEECTKLNISSKELEKYAGVRKYKFGQVEEKNQVAVVNGLAYTEAGGDLLVVEAISSFGKGKVTITGRLGDVMKESVQAAHSLVQSRCLQFGVIPPELAKKDIHIHFPEGAVPKDGPSAGIAIYSCIISLLTDIPIHKDIAMTGEITLRGRVLPIGGLKEKLLAALRGGIKKVLIPVDNEKDLKEIPDNVKDGMEIITVSTVDEVLHHTLIAQPQPIEWDGKVDVINNITDASDNSLRH